MKDRAAVVGVGATPYYKRGQSLPQTQLSMACTAILRGLDDAGLAVSDLDGFAIYSNSVDPAQVASVLGVPEVRFAASLAAGGGRAGGPRGRAGAAHPCGYGGGVRDGHDPPAGRPPARGNGGQRPEHVWRWG